ncbi:MAG: C39 family peptidase [Planctomycetes bacterium]|nr:C39 family peptidase [Planctomycetota bacterium]
MIRDSLAILRCGAVCAAFCAAALPAFGAPREVKSQPRAAAKGAPVRDEEHTFRRHVKSWRELQRENVVMQQRDYSCGAAALATLIRYHWGDEVTEIQLLVEVVRMLTPEEMKERIKNGLSLTDLRRLAVRSGYLATIGRLEFEKLREVKVPLIVGITVNDFDHFVVYRGTDGQYVYLADPARGNVRTPIPEFLRQWQKNAVLVVVKRGAEAEKKSPLLVRPEEIFLGELNRLYVRKRLEPFTPTLPR